MKTAVMICPGRGTYNKSELGVLARHFPNPSVLAAFDAQRAAQGQETLTALDGAARFSHAKHGAGDNASALIFAASYGDFLAVNRSEIDVVAVTGNSMGWYSALGCGGAVSADTGFDIVNTMGRWMHEDGAGGQIVYPYLDDDWAPRSSQKAELLERVAHINARAGHALFLSIDLGGMLVLAGDEAGLSAFEADVPARGHFPMRLKGHAGFHSDLVASVSERAMEHFPITAFQEPKLPMIDGRGAVWWPGATDQTALKTYTFGTQVTQPYDFTKAITVAAREFAPDLFIVAGPGTTLGGAVAQSLILAGWQGMTGKDDFQGRQRKSPFLISMGREDQRHIVAEDQNDA